MLLCKDYLFFLLCIFNCINKNIAIILKYSVFLVKIIKRPDVS